MVRFNSTRCDPKGGVPKNLTVQERSEVIAQQRESLLARHDFRVKHVSDLLEDIVCNPSSAIKNIG